MNTPPPFEPPPIPPAPGRSRLWIILTIVGVLLLVVVGAIGFGGYSLYKKTLEKRAAAKGAYEEIAQTGDQVRSEMADMVESGDVQGGGELIGRMKEQMEKSATRLGPGEAAAARAMATVMTRMQSELGEYEKVVAEITKEDVFSFNVDDRARLQAHRQLIREFQATNNKLIETSSHTEEMVRAALADAKVPPAVSEATMKGFLESQQRVGNTQLRIRKADAVLGETCQSIYDLLEKNWGKWRHNASGELIFDDDATLAAFQVLTAKIVDTGDEQMKAQEELAAKMRALKGM